MNLTKKNKKAIMSLIIFTGVVLWCVLNYKLFVDLICFILKLILPIIVGVGIAFIINVPMKLIETKIFKIYKRKHKKFVRAVSLVLSYVLIFGLITLILFLVLPQVGSALTTLSKNLPDGFDWLKNNLEHLSKSYPELSDKISQLDYKQLIGDAFSSFGSILTIAIAFVKKTVSRAITFFVGLVLSIYILADKEGLATRSKRVLTALFNDNVVGQIIKIVKLTNESFSRFITGQCLDAFLLGIIFFICMSILKMPYALAISVLLSTTALIPFVGAFITLAAGAILIAVTDPIKALWYVVMFFALQFFDDNVMNPRVVGKHVGLPPLIALIAVVIGGSIFGFLGMIISVPLASIIYTLFKEFIDDRLSKKNTNNVNK